MPESGSLFLTERHLVFVDGLTLALAMIRLSDILSVEKVSVGLFRLDRGILVNAKDGKSSATFSFKLPSYVDFWLPAIGKIDDRVHGSVMVPHSLIIYMALSCR